MTHLQAETTGADVSGGRVAAAIGRRRLGRAAFCDLSGFGSDKVANLVRRGHLPFLAPAHRYGRLDYSAQAAVLAAAAGEFTRAGGMDWALVAAAFATKTPADIFAVARPAGTWLAIAEDESAAELLVGSWLALGRVQQWATRVTLVDLTAVLMGLVSKARALGIAFDLLDVFAGTGAMEAAE